MNIAQAQYTNAVRTAAVIHTDEAGAVLITEADTDLWAAMLAAGTPTDVAAPVMAPTVPASVSQRQARLALLQAGHLQAVEDAINVLPADQSQAARIQWDFASSVERASPLVATLGAALGLSDADMDSLFVSAGRL